MIGRSISFIALSAISTLSGLILFPLYTKYLQPVEFGFYSIIISLSTFSSLISGLGLYNSMSNFFFDVERKKRKEFLNILFSTTILVNVCLSIFLIALISLIFDYKFDLKIILSLAILLGVIESMNAMFFQYLRNTGKNQTFLVLSSINILSSVATTVILLYSGFGLWSAVLGKLTIGILIFSGILVKEIRFCIDINYVRPLFMFGLKMIPALLLTWIFQYADRFISETFLEPADFGNFGFVISASSLVMTGFLAIANSIQPELYKSFQQNIGKTIASLTKHYLILCSVGLFCVMSTILLINEFWLSFKYYNSISALSLFSGGFILLSVQHLLNLDLIFHKHVRKLTLLQNFSYASYSITLLILFSQGFEGLINAGLVFFTSRIISVILYGLSMRNTQIIQHSRHLIIPFCLLTICLTTLVYNQLS